MALNKAKLEKYLTEFSGVADDLFADSPWLRQRFDFFQHFFKAERLETVEWDQFQKLRDNIHCFTELALAGAKALGTPNHGIEHYRKAFHYLAHGPGDVFARISAFDSSAEYRVKYFGQGAISEMAGYLFAEKVMFFNSRDEHGAKFFGVERKTARGEKLGDKVRTFTEAMEPVLSAYGQLVGWKTDLPHYLELDQFFSWLYENHRKTVDDEVAPKDETAPSSHEGPAESPAVGAGAARTNHPLNQILYGPPGTGKTYQTFSLAHEICFPGKPLPADRREVVEAFKRLRQEGRVEVVTFHQSYGYEEFVEGIRPEVDRSGETTGSLSYSIEDGVFKRICLSAKDAMIAEGRKRYAFDPGKTTFWKMSLGNTASPEEAHVYNTCIGESRIILGWGRGLDYSDCNSTEKIRDRLKSLDSSVTDADYNITAVNYFRNVMKEGDLVVISDGNLKFRAIGRITGPYYYQKHEEWAQYRPVEWLAVFPESLPRERILSVNFSQMTIYRLSPDKLKMEALAELLSGEKKPEERNHVLIIDELNRGNVSKILGEIITLIEPDKRLGEENELTVRLPHSREEFGIPANLYVIGTMNSADRSIAFIDTALRRRFEFREVAPDSEILQQMMPDGGLIDGVDVPTLFNAINDRIELLFDRDHTLGHSYFIRVETLEQLKQVFLKNVLPQLQEYFYDDWQRICMVVGCPYHTDSEKPATTNPAPVLVVNRLAASELLMAANGDFEDQLRYFINPEFREAGGSALAPFFQGIMGQKSTATTE